MIRSGEVHNAHATDMPLLVHGRLGGDQVAARRSFGTTVRGN
jgi:hypothetical protein